MIWRAPTEATTVDGFAVKAGDYVWRERCGAVRRMRLAVGHIRCGWVADAYASERACVEASIAKAKEKAKRAARDLKREKAYAERLMKRLRELKP